MNDGVDDKPRRKRGCGGFLVLFFFGSVVALIVSVWGGTGAGIYVFLGTLFVIGALWLFAQGGSGRS